MIPSKQFLLNCFHKQDRRKWPSRKPNSEGDSIFQEPCIPTLTGQRWELNVLITSNSKAKALYQIYVCIYLYKIIQESLQHTHTLQSSCTHDFHCSYLTQSFTEWVERHPYFIPLSIMYGHKRKCVANPLTAYEKQQNIWVSANYGKLKSRSSGLILVYWFQ